MWQPLAMAFVGGGVVHTDRLSPAVVVYLTRCVNISHDRVIRTDINSPQRFRALPIVNAIDTKKEAPPEGDANTQVLSKIITSQVQVYFPSSISIVCLSVSLSLSRRIRSSSSTQLMRLA